MRLKPIYKESELHAYINKSGYYDGIRIMAPIELSRKLEIVANDRFITCDNIQCYISYGNYAMHAANSAKEEANKIMELPKIIDSEQAGLISMCELAIKLLYNSTRTEVAESHSAIEVFGDNVHFWNFHLKGIQKTYTNDWMTDGIMSGIKFSNPFGRYSISGESTITGFNWGGVWAFDVKSLTVDRSTQIIGPSTSYFNYGIWQGGRGNAVGQKLYVTECIFEKVRHAIGASGHPNDYFAHGNIIIDTIKHAFDRHAINGYGGRTTHIVGNKFLNPNRYAFSSHMPTPDGSFVFKHNELKRAKEKPLGELVGFDIDNGIMTDPANMFDSEGRQLVDISCNTFGI